MQYTAIFHSCKNVHFQMICLIYFSCFYSKHWLWVHVRTAFSEAVLTSTHDLCFGAKIRKNVYPCKSQFYYIKVGCKGVFITRTCYPDDTHSTDNDKMIKACDANFANFEWWALARPFKCSHFREGILHFSLEFIQWFLETTRNDE